MANIIGFRVLTELSSNLPLHYYLSIKLWCLYYCFDIHVEQTVVSFCGCFRCICFTLHLDLLAWTSIVAKLSRFIVVFIQKYKIQVFFVLMMLMYLNIFNLANLSLNCNSSFLCSAVGLDDKSRSIM